jgi:OmpA-OmpF porin, OOP family
MKKHLLAALVTSAFAFPMAAHAAGSYVGINAGSVEHKASIDGASDSENKTGFKVYGGYGFTENFGVELGYANLGKVSSSINDGFDNGSLTYKSHAVYLAGTATLPLTPQFSLFGKAGITANRGKLSATLNGESDSFTRTNTTAMFGVGAEFNFSKNLSVVAEYENFGKVIDENEGNTKAQMVSVGLRYKF